MQGESIEPPAKDDPPNLIGQTCTALSQGESFYGACDSLECGRDSVIVCASDNGCCPCARHVQHCTGCGKAFCKSSDRSIWACFDNHLIEGRCPQQLLTAHLARLANALGSPQHAALDEFVSRNSDGLWNPLPREVPESLGLAVACLTDTIPEYNADMTLRQEMRQRRRTEVQRLRRAKRKHSVSVAVPRHGGVHLSQHRNSTIYLATAALITSQWTGRWHYPEQNEILRIMGLARSSDFIRDRVDALRDRNAPAFNWIRLRAVALTKSLRGR